MLATSPLTALMLVIPAALAHTIPSRPGSGFMPKRAVNKFNKFAAPKLTGCDLSKAVLPLPATAAAANVSIPAGEKVAFVGLGVGVQVC